MAINKELEVVFLEYVQDITNKFTSDTSLIDNQYSKLDEIMESYGIDNQQKSAVIAELTKTIIAQTGQEISSSALALLKLDMEKDLNDIMLLIKQEELKIKKTEGEIAKVKLEIARLEKAGMACKNKLLCAQADTEVAKKADVEASTELKQAQKATEVQRTSLTRMQTLLVDRQRRGYGDNLLIKAAEFRGGLASFAMNSAPENSTTQSIVNQFNATVAQLQGRSGW